jgi:16S rRNA (uracil1498-N3)-methyltransferase
MRIPRIYCANKLQPNAEIKLGFKASNHILHVLRLKLESPLILFNGTGGEYNSYLFAIDKQHAIVKVTEFINREAESPLKIYLGQGISRVEKMDYTIQKAVELGVHNITPLFTERCNVKLSGERLQKRLQHWRSIAISACEQCGRNRIPIINEPQYLNTWIAQTHSGINLLLSHRATKKIADLLSQTAAFTILIGPEGGLTESEIQNAEQHNFMPICFGPRIMRTESAALAAISILQFYCGDM